MGRRRLLLRVAAFSGCSHEDIHLLLLVDELLVRKPDEFEAQELIAHDGAALKLGSTLDEHVHEPQDGCLGRDATLHAHLEGLHQEGVRSLEPAAREATDRVVHLLAALARVEARDHENLEDQVCESEPAEVDAERNGLDAAGLLQHRVHALLVIHERLEALQNLRAHSAIEVGARAAS